MASATNHGDVYEDSADAGLGVRANPGLGRSRLSADHRFRKWEHDVHRDLAGRETHSATLLATAKFTVSNWSGTSFVMTVTNVRNTMPTSPDINARLTAFGFGLMPDGTFSNLVPGSIYQWAFTNFPAFQRVDVCLTSGSGCAGGGYGGLNQGQSTADSHSVTITGNFTNGVTIAPIPAKFQTSLGSLETDGVVIDPPPVGCERPHHYEDAQPEHRRPRGDRHVHRDGLKRRELRRRAAR